MHPDKEIKPSTIYLLLGGILLGLIIIIGSINLIVEKPKLKLKRYDTHYRGIIKSTQNAIWYYNEKDSTIWVLIDGVSTTKVQFDRNQSELQDCPDTKLLEELSDSILEISYHFNANVKVGKIIK